MLKRGSGLSSKKDGFTLFRIYFQTIFAIAKNRTKNAQIEYYKIFDINSFCDNRF